MLRALRKRRKRRCNLHRLWQGQVRLCRRRQRREPIRRMIWETHVPTSPASGKERVVMTHLLLTLPDRMRTRLAMRRGRWHYARSRTLLFALCASAVYSLRRVASYGRACFACSATTLRLEKFRENNVRETLLSRTRWSRDGRGSV